MECRSGSVGSSCKRPAKCTSSTIFCEAKQLPAWVAFFDNNDDGILLETHIAYAFFCGDAPLHHLANSIALEHPARWCWP